MYIYIYIYIYIHKIIIYIHIYVQTIPRHYLPIFIQIKNKRSTCDSATEALRPVFLTYR